MAMDRSSQKLSSQMYWYVLEHGTSFQDFVACVAFEEISAQSSPPASLGSPGDQYLQENSSH